MRTNYLLYKTSQSHYLIASTSYIQLEHRMAWRSQRFYTTLFPKLEEFAHPVVQETIEIVESLQREWQNRNNSNVLHLNHLFDIIDNNAASPATLDLTRQLEILRYFAAAVIYAQAIAYSATKKHEHEESVSDLQLPESCSNITIDDLNGIAEQIIKDFFTLTDNHQNYRAVDESEAQIRQLKEAISGRLADLKSAGSIPFMKVPADMSTDVFIRRGFEICRQGAAKGCKFKSADQTLVDFPVYVTRNGQRSRETKETDKLSDIISEKNILETMLQEKYITCIHKHIRGGGDREAYEIDFADAEITSTPQNVDIDPVVLQKLAGRKRLDAGKTKFAQEDILVSYFSHILFQQKTAQVQHQELENWSSKKIVDFLSPSNRPNMYIGFCFASIIDSGYSDKDVRNGSTNVLLIALTRGLVKYYDNLTSRNHLLRNELEVNEEEREKEAQPSFRPRLNLWISKIRHCRHLPKDDGKCLPESGAITEAAVDEEIGKEIKRLRKDLYLSATSHGILVKIGTCPYRFYFCLFLLLAISFFYSVVRFVNLKTRNLFTIVSYLGNVAEVFSALLAIFLLLGKFIYPKWGANDFLHWRWRTRSLSELAEVSGGKDKALKLCAGIRQADRIFSPDHSCAFSVKGEGDFIIDKPITIHELLDAGYKFGVNYYGEPVATDVCGVVRELFYPGTEREHVHIGAKHKLQTELIFQLPARKVKVGSRKKTEKKFKSPV